MLLRRLAQFGFTKKLAIPKGTRVPDCARCFANTVVWNAAALQMEESAPSLERFLAARAFDLAAVKAALAVQYGLRRATRP